MSQKGIINYYHTGSASPITVSPSSDTWWYLLSKFQTLWTSMCDDFLQHILEILVKIWAAGKRGSICQTAIFTCGSYLFVANIFTPHFQV